MENSRGLVLAIYPNMRGFGYAVIAHKESQDPKDCGVASVAPMNNRLCLARVKKFIEHYNPALIIVQNVHGVPSRKRRRVKRLIGEINDFCQQEGIAVCSYSEEQVQLVFEQLKVKTKHQFARAVVEWLPQFKNKLPRYRKPWMSEDYSMGMFDALALAVAHFYYTD